TNAVNKTDWKPLAGLKCIGWGDADEAGDNAMRVLADILSRLNPPASLHLFPGRDRLADGQGAADVAAEPSLFGLSDSIEPAELADELRRMVTPEPDPEPETSPEPPQQVDPPAWHYDDYRTRPRDDPKIETAPPVGPLPI